jgi:hypothetical protein
MLNVLFPNFQNKYIMLIVFMLNAIVLIVVAPIIFIPLPQNGPTYKIKSKFCLFDVRVIRAITIRTKFNLNVFCVG